MNENLPATPGGVLTGAPIMSAAQVKQQATAFCEYLDAVNEFVKSRLQRGEEPGEGDYGPFPGAKRPALYQSGADKLKLLFGALVQLELVRSTELPGGHREYLYRARLYRGDTLLGEADGVCSTMETKYRYRKSGRVCPECGAGAIKRSQFPDRNTGEKGWYCHDKAGGCGTQFKADDPRVLEQQTGRIENEDIADTYNTVCQMAQKRADVRVVRKATATTDLFTQEDEAEEGDEPPEPARPQKPTGPPPELPKPGEILNMARLLALLGDAKIKNTDAIRRAKQIFNVPSLSVLTDEQRADLYADLTRETA